jgi:hypothetical protein
VAAGIWVCSHGWKRECCFEQEAGELGVAVGKDNVALSKEAAALGVAVGKVNVAFGKKQMNWGGSWKSKCCFEQEEDELGWQLEK